MDIGDPVMIMPEAVAAEVPTNPTVADPLDWIKPIAVVVDDPVSAILVAAVIVPIAEFAVVPVGDSELEVTIIPAEVVALIPASASATELVADITPMALVADTPANGVPCDDTIAPVEVVAIRPPLKNDDPSSSPKRLPGPDVIGADRDMVMVCDCAEVIVPRELAAETPFNGRILLGGPMSSSALDKNRLALEVAEVVIPVELS
jgi:hypothetical protein